MDCEQARVDLASHVLGALDAADGAEMEAHLAGCPLCALERESLARVAVLVTVALLIRPAAPPPADPGDGPAPPPPPAAAPERADPPAPGRARQQRRPGRGRRPFPPRR
ncbi:hypothetical protein GCM10027168_52200 [Streptomyces capparidis]